MAPLVGKFDADFEAFHKAVDQSIQDLDALESKADKVGPAIDTMIGKAPAGLSTVATTADAAGQALNSLGAGASEAEKWLAGTAQASADFHDKAQALQATLTQQADALKNLGGASGGAIDSLVLLNTVELAAQASMAGWAIGRRIAEFFDLDKAVGAATASLLGWGDAAKEAAGANADVLAKASKIAGREITDLGTAMAINEGATKEWAQSLNTSAARVAAWRGELDKVRSGGSFELLAKDIESHNFSLKELATRYGLSVEAIQFFTRETKNAAEAEKEAATAVEESNRRKIHALKEEVAEHQAAAALKAKTTLELTKLEEQYNIERVRQGGTANEKAIADIERWAAIAEDRLHKAGIVSKDVYAQLAKDSKQAMDGVGIDWDVFRTKSIPALQELATNALRTYNEMVASGKFHRAELDAQLAKYHELQDAARGYGKDSVEAHEAARKAAEKHNAALEAQRKAIEAAADAERRRQQGFAFDVTSSNFAQTLAGLGVPGIGGQAEGLAREGYSLQEIVAILRGGSKGSPHGPRIPGFAGGVFGFSGGMAVVGERGPELVSLPTGSSVIPLSGGGAGSVTQIFNLYGTPESMLQKLKDLLMRDARTRRQFGAA